MPDPILCSFDSARTSPCRNLSRCFPAFRRRCPWGRGDSAGDLIEYSAIRSRHRPQFSPKAKHTRAPRDRRPSAAIAATTNRRRLTETTRNYRKNHEKFEQFTRIQWSVMRPWEPERRS